MLKTGTRLTPAINLYEAMRYARIPLFGEYLSSPPVLRQITCVNDTTPEWSPSGERIAPAADRSPLRR